MAITMYKVAEVARLLNVSVGCVYALVESGRLACHRIGLGRGAVRISDADLNHYLASSRHEKDGGVYPTSLPRPKVKLKLKHLHL